MATLVRISFTPIKGTALLHPERVALTTNGIPHDRRFFLIDESGSLFSGGDFGPLVRVRSGYDPRTGALTCAFPDGSTVEGDGDRTEGRTITDFYGRPVPGAPVTGPFSDAFTDLVGRQVRLVRAEVEGDATDVHHLTLVSTASVRALAVGAGSTGELDPRRFRINLELGDCAPYEEDTWAGRRVLVGSALVRVGVQIPRCLVTTQSPTTGLKDFDTLKAIAVQRSRIADGGLPFGMYAEVEEPGEVALGDDVSPV